MKKLITTICFGDEYVELAKVTHPSLRSYAAKINADFAVITDREFPDANICYEKLQVRHLLKQYDRIIYMDTDVVVKQKCPDLTDIVPIGYFGAFSEGQYLDRQDCLKLAELQFGLNAMEWHPHYFNAGVMVMDQSHTKIFEPPAVFHDNFGDQTYLNTQVFKLAKDKFLDIGPHFNRMMSIDWDLRGFSYIIHYAGGPAHREFLRRELG